MNKQLQIQKKKNLTKKRVRARISADSKRPRLSINISLNQVYAQIIDDTLGVTLVSTSSLNQKELEKKSLTDKAQWVGSSIAESAKTKKITNVIFDRGNRQYHGRVKVLAEAARKKGLKF